MKPKCEIDSDGNKFYKINGKLHREDGPAIEYADGDKHWYINGKCHREDGPAVECANGTKYWHINGKLIGKGKMEPKAFKAFLIEFKLIGK